MRRIFSRGNRRTSIAAFGILAVATSAVAVLPSSKPGDLFTPRADNPVDVSAVAARAPEPPEILSHSVKLPPAAWPAGGRAEVTVPAAGVPPVRAGSLPVTLAGKGDKPVQVSVEVLDRRQVAPELATELRIRRVDGKQGPAPVAVTVDYAAFASAYGGDWSGRLGLVTLPERKPIRSANSPVKQAVSGLIDVGSGGGSMGVMASPSGGTGDYKATSLSPSGAWDVSEQTGDFSWSYPLRMPGVPGGLTPSLSASYASSAVDGRTASTNNQPSWLGEGWDLWSGFIERSYKGCGDDGVTPKTGDLCWGGENASLSLSGRSGPLVLDTASNTWHPKSDDGTKVERLFGAVNGDNDGEYWKLTTTDGTQYFFGLNRRPGWQTGNEETKSAWSTPVFGNNPGEPCNGAAYASSWCQQAYRWNLDFVQDVHGNTMSFLYNTESNSYGLNNGATTAGYTRGGTLARADYGTRAGDSLGTTAPARVLFTTADRCAPGTDCNAHNATSYPDTPWDLECSANCGSGKPSPTFWSTKRLASVRTELSGQPVDSWAFEQTFPNPGDGTSAALWLSKATHTGEVGGSAALPAMTFDGVQKANRVNSAPDGLPPLNKYRMSAINNESGGRVGVTYEPTNCAAGSLPTPDTNTTRCFPEQWTPEGGQPFTDWFHKYAVDQVAEVDNVGGTVTRFTDYTYEGGGAWAYNDNPLIPVERRTWDQWRGYEKVLTVVGDPTAQDPRSATRSQYFRGMNGDKLAGGGTRSASVTDSQGVTLPDDAPLAGFTREATMHDGVGGSVVSTAISSAWQKQTGAQGTRQSTMVRQAKTTTRAALAAGGWRVTESSTSYDDLGFPTEVDDKADLGTAADDRCTRTWYARNTGAWLLTLPSRAQTVGVACAATPAYPADAISDTRTSYDGGASGDAPVKGDVTKVENAKDYVGGQPSYITGSRATYDGYGRTLDSFDALDRKTTTAYTPVTGPPTSSTVTNPAGHVTTTTVDARLGQPTKVTDANNRVTDLTYDPLGRITGVWLPGRSKAGGWGPNTRYTYTVRDTGPSWVSTESLKPNGNYVTSYALLDGFLRARQSQSPAEGGGRLITDTLYDSRGNVVKTNAPYLANGAPDTTLMSALDNEIPAQTLSEIDGVGRVTAAIFRSLAVEKWRTTTSYGGDRTSVTPPAGGTPTTTLVDARGQATELRQYKGAAPTGAYDATTYGYTKAGQRASVTDAAGNAWAWTYDLLGRKTRSDDPDKGAITSSYDGAGQLLSSTDARGQVLSHVYDVLGRKVETHDGPVTGPLLAKSTYDTLAGGKGLLVKSDRFAGGNVYTTAVTGYETASGRPTGQTVTIPAVQTGLAGSYTTSFTYRVDGSLATVAMPAVANLSAETLTYSYGALGLPNRMTSGYGGATTYVDAASYTPQGEVSLLKLGSSSNQVWQSAEYDQSTRRLARTVVQKQPSAAVVDDTSYAYDSAGNVTGIAQTTSGSATDRQCFKHDYLRRLTEAWTPATDCAGQVGANLAGPAPYWQTYGYDVTGNRTSLVKHGVGGGSDTTSTYSYPAAGQARPHAVQSVSTGGATDNYSYDAAGNAAARPGHTLTWDQEGHLAGDTEGSSTAGYVYNTDGSRLLSVDSTGKTLYLGDAELRYTTSTGAKQGTRYYKFAARTIATRSGLTINWLVGDHHGTDNLTIDHSTGAVTARRTDPFGNLRGTAPSSWPGTHGFVGGVQDPTGLTHLGAREYDPKIGKFVSVDPIIEPADPQQMNAYSYAGNTPVTMSDPTGLLGCSGPDGIGCGHPESKKGYDMQSESGRGAYSRDRKKFLDQETQYYQRARARENGQKASDKTNEMIRSLAGQMSPAMAAFNTNVDTLNTAAEAVDVLSKRGIKSGSICLEGSAGLGWGFAAEGCVNIGAGGVSLSWNMKTGLDFGAHADVSFVIKLTTADIPTGASTNFSGSFGSQAALNPAGERQSISDGFRKLTEPSHGPLLKDFKAKAGWSFAVDNEMDKNGDYTISIKVTYGIGASVSTSMASWGGATQNLVGG